METCGCFDRRGAKNPWEKVIPMTFYREAVLTGAPQFIMTALTFLVTTNQAGFILRLEGVIAKAIDDKKDITRHRANWQIFLVGWWILTGTAIGTIFIRIIPSMFIDDPHERINLWFIIWDFLILFSTAVGYALLAAVALRSWDWNKWHGKSQN